MIELNENVKLLAPWSASKLKLIKNCGYKFWTDYVYKVKTGGKHPTEPVQSEALALGTFLHSVIETALKLKNRGAIKSMMEAERERFPKIDQYDFGLHNLYDRISAFMISQPSAKLYIEKGFGVGLESGKEYSFFSNDSIMRVRLDILIEYINPINKKKTIKIIDVKSGKYYEKETTEQLNLYAAAVKLARPDVSVVTYQAALINQNLEDLVLTPKVIFNEDKPEKVILDLIEEYTQHLPEDLTKLYKERKYLSTKDYMCTSCPVKKWCPKHGGEPIEVE